MNDMSAVIVAKSDQWNADDFTAGPRTFTVEDVTIRPGTEQPVSIKLAGSDKVFRPCKTVSRVLVAAWGADATAYRGRQVELYTNPEVTWGGMKVGGIRISRMSHLERPLVIALQEKKGSRKMTTVNPLAAQIAPIDEARAALNAATTLDQLRATWSAKAMAPFRAELQSLLDERKSALSINDDTLSPDNPSAGEGMADADRGERTSTDELIDLFDNATDQAGIDKATKAANVLGVDPAEWEGARDRAVERIGGGK